ncbi:MAG: FtsQ-type POTRA domain-containing protein, partial [Oscillospiraceae bacterium]
ILGSTVYSNDEIIASAKVKKGDNLFRTNIYQLEENIMDGLVNVEEVRVSRKLPSKPEISVTPCVATACMEYDGKYYTISRNGKILTNGLSQPEDGLFVIKGFDPVDCSLGAVIESNDEYKKDILNQIISGIEECSFEAVRSIDITDRLDIILNYDDRIEIELGSSLDLSYKISFSKAVIEQNNSDAFEGKLIMHGDSGASLIKKGDIT